MWNCVLDPSEVAVNRTELNINDGPGISIDQAGIDWGDSAITAFMADARMGSSKVDYRVPNRIITIPFGLGMGEGVPEVFIDARRALQQKVARIQDENGWFKRAPGLYAEVTNATLTIPDVTGEVGYVEANCKLALECLPDFFGDEITLDAAAVTTGTLDQVLKFGGANAMIQGDHPGRVRIVVSDSAATDRFGLLWGFRSKHYDSSAAGALVFTATNLVYGTWSTSNSITFSGSPATTAVKHILASSGETMMQIALPGGWLPHMGTYRVWVRAGTPTVPAPRLQLSYSVGPGPAQVNDSVAIPMSSGWIPTSLGLINLPSNPLAASKWMGSIKMLGTSGDTAYIHEVYLQPVSEFSGKLIGNITAGQPILRTGGQTEIRTDRVYLTDSTGAFGWGRLPEPYGDLPRIPTSGLENRPIELFVRPTMSDFSGSPDAVLGNFGVQVKYRPCYLQAI